MIATSQNHPGKYNKNNFYLVILEGASFFQRVEFSIEGCPQGMKLCLIQAPMLLNFSLWWANPQNKSPNWQLECFIRYSELKRFAKINPRQTSLLSLCPKRSTTSQSMTRRNLCFRWAWMLYIIHPSVLFVAH